MQMKEVPVFCSAGEAYKVYIKDGLLGEQGVLFQRWLSDLKPSQIAVVTNTTVASLYLNDLKINLDAIGASWFPVILADGEAYKSLQVLSDIWDALLEHYCDRDTVVLALGGGVVGDIAGFAAATYLRGVRVVQCPTTLLAMVDSSVGGKTAVNHAMGKNMIGAFHQPSLVAADVSTLNTLPDREFLSGLAEVIKYGLIRDLEFFEWLESNIVALVNRDSAALLYAVERSCWGKAQLVQEDALETKGSRVLLNLGHTFAHAIETLFGYGHFLHGEAVSIGLVMAAHLSVLMGGLSASEQTRAIKLLQAAKLPTGMAVDQPQSYLDLMKSDKKNRSGQIRLILLRALGSAYVEAEVPEALLLQTLRESTRLC